MENNFRTLRSHETSETKSHDEITNTMDKKPDLNKKQTFE